MQVSDGLRRYLQDLKNAKLIVIKVIYFFFLAAMVLPWPHFTIHQRELGISTYYTGVIGTALSVVSIFLPFWATLLGDKIGNFKVPMSITTALAGVNILLFTVVPLAHPTTTTTGHNITATGYNISATVATTEHNLTINSSMLMPIMEPDPERLNITFWSYLILRTSYGALTGIGFTLYDGAVMAYVQNQGVDYGFQRAWGTLAALCFSYAGGLIVEHTGHFYILFYVCGGLHVTTAAFMMLLELNFKLPTQSLTKEIISHLYNPKVVIFLCAMLLAGVVMGYLETFIYRYLGSLGGSPLLLSLTVAVVAPLNFFLTLASSFLVNLLGHAALISLGLFVISFRMFVYSMLVNPWWALPLEMLDALCSGLLTNVAIMYCTVLFSSKSITSSRGIISALNFGLGQLLGNLVGTEIREVMGDRATLQVFGGAAFVSAVLYGAAYLFITRQSLFTHSSTQGSNSPTETTNNHGTDNKSFEDTIEMEPSDSGTTENTREVL